MSLVRHVATLDRSALLRSLGVDPALFDAFLVQQGQGASTPSETERKGLDEAIVLYLSAYLPEPASHRGSAATQKTYSGVLASFRSFMASRWDGLPVAAQTVDRITVTDVEDFVRRPLQDGSPRSAFSINRDTSILSSLMKWLGKHQYLPSNPVSLVDRAREPKLLPVALSESEQEALLDSSRRTTNGLRNHTIIHLVLNTGLRVDEVSRLCWSNFDLAQGWLHVKGKGKKERSIPLRPCVIESLEYYRTACRNTQVAAPGCEGALFISQKGARWGHPMSVDALEDMLKPLLVRLGKPVGNMHVLRHSFAVNLLRRGVHIVVINHLLGHELFETTRRYLRVGSPELAQELAEYFPEGVLVPSTMKNVSSDQMEEWMADVYND